MNHLTYTITFWQVLFAIAAFGAVTLALILWYARTEIDALSESNADKEVSISELAAKVKDKEAAVAGMNTNALVVSSHSLALARERDSLKAELHETKTYLTSAENEVKELKAERDRLIKQIERTGLIRLANGQLRKLPK